MNQTLNGRGKLSYFKTKTVQNLGFFYYKRDKKYLSLLKLINDPENVISKSEKLDPIIKVEEKNLNYSDKSDSSSEEEMENEIPDETINPDEASSKSQIV